MLRKMVTNGKKNGHGGARNSVGHPITIQIDWELVSKLAQLQCTEEEIAFVCKCSRQTLYNHAIRTQGCTFVDYLEQHRHGGKASLRRMQFESAQKGNITMQIWLGKQYLGQTDKQELAGIGDKGEIVFRVKYDDDSDKRIHNPPAQS